MKILNIFLLLLIGCNNFSDASWWGHRLCKVSSNECFEIDSKFKKEESCLLHIDYINNNCLHGPKLKSAKSGDPVCWRSDFSSARSECIEL